MSMIYSCGEFHVEAVIVKGRPVFRVCRYQGTESTILDTFESGGLVECKRKAIARCDLWAELAEVYGYA